MLISWVREKLFVDSGIYANLKTYYNLYFHKNPYIQYTVYTHIQLIYTILLYYHNLSLRPRNIYIYTFSLKNITKLETHFPLVTVSLASLSQHHGPSIVHISKLSVERSISLEMYLICGYVQNLGNILDRTNCCHNIENTESE